MRMSGSELSATTPDLGDKPHDVFWCVGDEIDDLVQMDIWRRQLPVTGPDVQVNFPVGLVISRPDEAAPADGSAGFQLGIHGGSIVSRALRARCSIWSSSASGRESATLVIIAASAQHVARFRSDE